jgi:hypothetical protein
MFRIGRDERGRSRPAAALDRQSGHPNGGEHGGQSEQDEGQDR